MMPSPHLEHMRGHATKCHESFAIHRAACRCITRRATVELIDLPQVPHGIGPVQCQSMDAPGSIRHCSRRHFLVAAAAGALPAAAPAVGVYTPYELAQQYERQVDRRLRVPEDEMRLYCAMSEMQLFDGRRELLAPQYLLIVDSSPDVQAALLFWRLLAGSYRLIGASPVSTGSVEEPDDIQTPLGVFEQNGTGEGGSGCGALARPVCGRAQHRVYDFGWQQTRRASGAGGPVGLRLQLRAADRTFEPRLGSACSDGCILLPASLITFLDEYGLLDGSTPGAAALRTNRPALPFRGRHLLVVDSDRNARPPWSPAPG